VPGSRPSPGQRASHWDSAYVARGVRSVSWYQAEPRVSVELVAALSIPREAAVIDIGGGSAYLADRLVEQGFSDVTVLDISEAALAESRRRFGDDARICRLHEDLLVWRPERRYDLWHDRAVFHFLVEGQDRERYLRALSSAIRPGGMVILATFAADGPETCSGLPVARYSPDGLSLVLGKAFERLAVRREVHVTPTGSRQPFTWVAGRMAPDRP
jgi:2-polyprenyl-3-methyl-5-hydroxy-6-metoxy-1,4-benzoquinol methylase